MATFCRNDKLSGMEGFKLRKPNVEKSPTDEIISPSEQIEMLLSEFPEELVEKLESETENLSDQDAITYITNKLTAREKSFDGSHLNMDGVTAISETPEGLRTIIDAAVQGGEDTSLGQGKNGEVFADNLESSICYKVFFLEKAKQMQVNIFKEASLQHRVHTFLSRIQKEVQVPEIRYVIKNDSLYAIAMERVDGFSLTNILEGKEGAVLPEGFSVDDFFDKLERAVSLMNENGYFHCDLTNNAGNVMVDKEGNPWIVDFGAMVKSISSEQSPEFYQLRLGGLLYRAKDLYGLSLLKQRLVDHITKQGV